MAGAKQRAKSGTFEDRFIGALMRECGESNVPVSTRVLREKLGWQDDRFEQVRAETIKKGIAVRSPGQGGKTRFSDEYAKRFGLKSLRAFVSYSHVDEKMKDEFLKHLEPIKKLGLIECWHDTKIKIGDDLDREISKELDRADIIFILVSIDFINSSYCYDNELARAIERHEEGSARVVPVILRDCLWKQAPFGKLKALPKDAKAVTSYSNQDAAFSEIAHTTLDLAKELLGK